MPSLFVFVGATPADQDPAKAAPNHNPNFIVDDATLKTGVGRKSCPLYSGLSESSQSGTNELEAK